MSTYVPKWSEIKASYVSQRQREFHTQSRQGFHTSTRGIASPEQRAEWEAEADAWFATVRSNPDDARQVETGARALFSLSGEIPYGATWEGTEEYMRASFRSDARAVLTALTKMGGGMS